MKRNRENIMDSNKNEDLLAELDELGMNETRDEIEKSSGDLFHLECLLPDPKDSR